MMIAIYIIFFLSIFIIFWANIGYPISILILGKVKKQTLIMKNYSYEPTVTVLIVAHNEEKIINQKLDNVISLDYPQNKIKFVVTSDNSNDSTNLIVEEFMHKHPSNNLSLYLVKDRKGKTNAQNEAVRYIDSDIVVMTDANSMLEKNSVREIIANFSDKRVSYVCGTLKFMDSNDQVGIAENSYWKNDVKIRNIESRIHSITAGNGALYACRKNEYVEFNPIESHDSSMPFYFVTRGKKAISDNDAIAYENAGNNYSDEFNRKVRMNRLIFKNILPSLTILNVFKYGWYTYFYLGHRTFRYLLWLSHTLLIISNIILSIHRPIFLIILCPHIIVYLIAILKHIFKFNSKYVNFIYYYIMTIIAQWVGVYKIITKKSKPFWEKAESTRRG